MWLLGLKILYNHRTVKKMEKGGNKWAEKEDLKKKKMKDDKEKKEEKREEAKSKEKEKDKREKREKMGVGGGGERKRDILTPHLFFTSSSLDTLRLNWGSNCCSSSLTESLSACCAGRPFWLANWKVLALPSCITTWSWTLSLLSGEIFWTEKQTGVFCTVNKDTAPPPLPSRLVRSVELKNRQACSVQLKTT